MTLDQLTKLYPMFRILAPMLAGKPVEVRMRRPARQGIWGMMITTSTGTKIDIDPTISAQNAYYVFLHECAHAKLHHSPSAAMAGEKLTKLAPGSLPPSPPVRLDPHIDRAEKEAEDLAAQWDKLAGEKLRRLRQNKMSKVAAAFVQGSKEYQKLVALAFGGGTK